MHATPETSPDRAADRNAGVFRIEPGDRLVTAIERFSLDGSESPAPGPGEAEDLTTHTQEPDSSTSPTLDRPETDHATAYLTDALRRRSGYVAGLLLAGHDGELVLYSQWQPAGRAPEQVPEEWSIAPALDGATRVDVRTYTVDFTAPEPLSTASADTPHAHFGVFTMPPENQERLLELARTHAPDSLGTPGLRSINFHRSLDGRRVVNLGLWSGFEEFTALLSTPGFGGGEEYWGDVAGFRPHYFDVAALVTA